MGRIQFIKRNGKREFAVVPIDLYDRWIEVLEDSEDEELLQKAINNDDGFRVPSSVVESIIDGIHPIQAWRQHRGYTLKELSAQCGLSTAYLSQIEHRKRTGSVKTILAIASALEVQTGDLVDPIKSDD